MLITPLLMKVLCSFLVPGNRDFLFLASKSFKGKLFQNKYKLGKCFGIGNYKYI
jgi:hypothetical protein